MRHHLISKHQKKCKNWTSQSCSRWQLLKMAIVFLNFTWSILWGSGVKAIHRILVLKKKIVSRKWNYPQFCNWKLFSISYCSRTKMVANLREHTFLLYVSQLFLLEQKKVNLNSDRRFRNQNIYRLIILTVCF